MADNEKVEDHDGQDIERKAERLYSSRVREQRMISKTKEKINESRLPTPPPDPWASPWGLENTENQEDRTRTRSLDEDEDIIAYLTDIGAPPFETQTSECPSRNSAMAVPSLCTEEAFEHLDRLCALTEQILELRDRNSKFFKRVRNLERLKVLRNADRRLENAFACDSVPMNDFCEEDTGFAEVLLDAMVSNCRDPPFQRRNIRSPSSRQTRSKSLALSQQSLQRSPNPVNRFDVEKQTFGDEISKGAPKVSKWTRVKAAFKWERACTNDAVETMDTTTAMTMPSTASSTPTIKYLRIPDSEIGNSSGTIASSCTSETCDSATTFGRISSASSSNEGSYDCSRKDVSFNLELLSARTKEDKNKPAGQRSCSLDRETIALNTEQPNDDETMNEVGQGKPLIRITLDKNCTTDTSNVVNKRDIGPTMKRPAPTLTITIPPHEEDFRCISSPESNSPLPSSAYTSGGSSPLHRKMQQELSTSKDFKRQQSTGDECVSPTTKMQRQDSKWNKVRRAFLTNSAFSVPPSPIRVISRQMFLNDGPETPYSYTGSVEDIEKMTALNGQAETRQDYRALREKLGAEFHRKLVEWERLKNLSRRVAAKNSREVPSGPMNPRETLLSEEKLAPEFRKKLQEWKRAKKGRRGSAPFEQQRASRRRLTDWQLWRFPSRSEYRNIGSRGSCESGESTASDRRAYLCKDFPRKTEARKTNNETSNCDAKPMWPNSNQLGVTTAVDDSEFLALERALSLFENGSDRERRESDFRQSEKYFDGDTRSYIDGSQGSNEIFVQTPVGSYRFEGISREFTRKLYDWERYRRISPESSTFRLLGPAYEPFTTKTDMETSEITPDLTKIEGDEETLFKDGTLKRSISVGNVVKETIQDESFMRHSTSLQSLNHLVTRFKNIDCIDSLPVSIDPQRMEDMTEDIMDDSEPEAMIVDIEDVIEETASPLERMQPHQTPVYSVAASETTSIAVPLGTVTSSHEPSPVFLVEIQDGPNLKRYESRRWKRRTNSSNQDALNIEHVEPTRIRNDDKASSRHDNADSKRWSASESLIEKENCTKDTFEHIDSDLDKDSMKSDNLIHPMISEQRCEIVKESTTKQSGIEWKREDIPATLSDGKNVTDAVDREPEGINENEAICGGNVGSHCALAIGIKMSTDLSSENKNEREYADQGPIGDGGSNNDEENVAMAKTKCDNEYEEIILDTVDPYYCFIGDTQLMTDSNKGNANALPTSLINCKLGKTNYTVSTMDPSKEADVFKTHEKNYGVMRDELYDPNTCRSLSMNELDLQAREISKLCTECSDPEKKNNYAAETAIATESTDTEGQQRCKKFENTSPRLKLCSANTTTLECNREPIVQTTPLSVAACREERCVERIIVNEETLNKIVVPTASPGHTDKLKDLKRSIECSTTKDSTDEPNRRSSSSDNLPINREATNVKKQYSPTRNVFIKTKRIIFSPFWRGEDQSAGKTENNASEDDHVFPLKGKSKSRSASPKINRQEPLLKMSFSLPWPLRSSSKDRDIKETKIEESDKEDRTVAERLEPQQHEATEDLRKSFNSRNTVVQQTQMEHKEQTLKENSRFKYHFGQKEREPSVSVRATPDIIELRNRTVTDSTSTLRNEEKKAETPSPLTFDPHASDLIHKLRILSNAVARRDGRTNTISEESSVEPHSLRIRRAKEHFLSRRGGPLCHSVLEPPSSNNHMFFNASADFRGTVSRYQQRIVNNEKQLDMNNLASKLEESSSGYKANEKEDESKVRRVEVSERNANELSRRSTVSRPDRVKSASVGMINVDPDTFERLTESSRGCESLPRTTSKQEHSRPFAKIVNKFKFTRLIRGKDIEERDMSTISRLCRQSLLIDVRNEFDRRWEAGMNKREDVSKLSNVDKVTREK